jgi:hypothetical protein
VSIYQSPDRPESMPPTHDMQMRHVFIVVGEKTLFLCHMINWWMEGHNWELVLRVTLEEAARKKILDDRDGVQPHFLANPRNDCFTHPELIRRSWSDVQKHRKFRADIWKGMGTGQKPKEPDHDWLPWDADTPLLANVEVTIEAVVHHRHANLNQTSQEYEQYLLFGKDEEAHIYHSPTREPDYDHVATLRGRPAWLMPEQVESGVVVSVPSLPWKADKTYCNDSLPINQPVDVHFHGITQYRTENWDDSYGPIRAVPSNEITLKRTWWYETRIINFFPPTGSQCI